MTRALMLVAAVAIASPAAAFVRGRTPAGVPVHWSGGCVFVTPDSDGTPDIPAADAFAAIERAVNNWDTGLAGQSYMKVNYEAPTERREAHLDGINIVKFRTDRWCHPNDDNLKDMCYSKVAAGITTVFYVGDGHSISGAIEDADIELNDINFTFRIEPSTAPLRPGTMPADLENTVTHELGHLLGLDHTCDDGLLPPQEVDENGKRPPSCSALGSLSQAERDKIATATMYNFYMPGETSKRMPKVDDLAGVANAYPTANDPHSCKHTDLHDFTSGCSIGGRASRSLASFSVLLGAFALLAARRRRRRRY